MTLFRSLMLAGLCLVSAQAFAQWQWIGNDGRKVFSDRPPPANIPQSRIIKSPGQDMTSGARPTAATPSRSTGNSPQYGDIKPEDPKKTSATSAGAGANAGAGASAGANAGTSAATPKPAAAASTAKDKAQEEKAKQAEAAEAAKRKAEQDRVAAVRAENCRRAQEAKSSLSSGMPMAKVDEDGKQVMLDDAARNAELKRAEEIIASDCGPAPKK